MPKRCLRCTISGKVQGVFFRANTQKQAQKLGITGWVRNLQAGTVETLICGEEDALLEKIPQTHVKKVDLKRRYRQRLRKQYLSFFTDYENFIYR